MILLVALAARIGFAWNQERKIPVAALSVIPFQQETGNIAMALASGQGFANVFRAKTGPTAWLAPVYPLLVAATFKIFGIFTARAFLACVALNILFSAGACVPLFYAGEQVAGRAAGVTAAWLWALFPNAILIPFEWVWDTSLSALLAAAILWATLKVADSRAWRDWCAYGLLWGLALMTNPALGALLPFLLGWAIYRGRRKTVPTPQHRAATPEEARLSFSRPMAAMTLTFLCCAPWMIRNYEVFHTFIPMRSNLPFELWVENNDLFDPHAINPRTRITRFEEVRTYAQLGESAYMHKKWELATKFILTHPALEIHLTANRFIANWMGTESPAKDFQRAESNFVRGVFIINVLAVAGALSGLVVLIWRRSVFAFPVVVFPVVFPLLYYITHASLRLRHPIDPILVLLAAIAVSALFHSSKSSPHKAQINTSS